MERKIEVMPVETFRAQVVRAYLRGSGEPRTAREIVEGTGLGWNEVDAALIALGALAPDGEVETRRTSPERFGMRRKTVEPRRPARRRPTQ